MKISNKKLMMSRGYDYLGNRIWYNPTSRRLVYFNEEDKKYWLVTDLMQAPLKKSETLLELIYGLV